jgi:UDP-N-acetylmuramate--alanine ligase
MFWDSLQKPSIHLIGIGGSGMSGIAEVLLSLGFRVSGSDVQSTATTKKLAKLGARIDEGHDASHIEGATCVVVSSAVSPLNPEWVEAQRIQIPVIPRAEMLAELMRLKLGVAIAGSHGKTTTTSMVGQILQSIDPTVVVGGRLQHWNASSIVGRGEVFVIEADESDRSFLKFSPVISVVTNIDREHLDTYRDLKDIEATFTAFMNRTAFFGMNWMSADCPSLRSIRKDLSKPVKTFGLSPDADLWIKSYQCEARRSFFTLVQNGTSLGEFELSVTGLHNVRNATAAIGVAMDLGVSVSEIKAQLKLFIPADRRLQIHAESKDWAVVEDYGHHPTEVEATLDALRLMFPAREIVVLFQPHRYSRTQALWKDFPLSFEGRCDRLFLMPIYSAHEEPIRGITHEKLAEEFTQLPVTTLTKIPEESEVLAMLSQLPANPRVILILGAGPLTTLALRLAQALSPQIETASHQSR